jgi:Ca2+-binding EF-hand superfamily protein
MDNLNFICFFIHIYTGEIDAKELSAVMKKLGKDLDKSQIAEMVCFYLIKLLFQE